MKAFNSIKNGVFLFLTVLLFVGCNNKENKPQTETEPATIEQENHKPQTHNVEIKDMKFQPEDLIVHVGDTVIWTNKDIVAHDVTETNKAWTSGPLVSDASWKKVIEKSDSYFCSIHVVMKGKITVE